MAQTARTAQWLAGRTSLVERAATMSPPARRPATTSTTPTGRVGNVAPPIRPTYTFGNQSRITGPNPTGNDPTALWGNLDLNQFNNTFAPGTLFGPERPLVPNEYENVRLRNYPVGYNLNYTPRSYEHVGFAELRAMAREVVLVRLAIETRKNQIERLDWTIKPKDEKNAPASAVKRAADAEKFWRKPDGVQPFAGWLREVMEEVLVPDALSLEIRRTRGGDIIGLDCIVGDTIKVLIDETGRWPRPPAPAYLQVIHGRPWRLLTTDNLIYAPRNRLATSPYGFSPVEQTLLFANIALRRSLKQLAHFTEGNVPAGMITGGEGWTPEALRAYYDFLNSELAGNVANQTRLFLAPHGATYQTFTEAPYKDDFDEWMARIICFAFDLPPTAFTKTQNRGEQEAIKDAAHEEGIASICSWVKRLIDGVIQERMGQADLEFVWSDEEDIDPEKQSTIVDQKLRSARMTLNEARDADGLEPVEGGDEPMIYLQSGPVLLKDVEAISDLAANPPPPVMAPSPNAVPGRGSSGGKPAPGKPGAGKPPAKGKPSASTGTGKKPPGGAGKPPVSARNSGSATKTTISAEPTMSMEEADYTDDGPDSSEWCNKCTMFRGPDRCTLVQGDISTRGHCKHFAPKAIGKEGGKVGDLIAELLSKKLHVEPDNAIDTTLPLADPVLEADVQHRAWALVRKDRLQLDERDVPVASLMACGQTVVDKFRVAQETKKWLKRGGQGKFMPLVMEHSGRHVILSGLHHSQAAVNAGAAEMRVQVMSEKE